MTVASAIAAFKDLQDLTLATEAQLESMLAYGCAPRADANFEDVVTEHLLRVFRHITGVPWVRGWEQGSRPDQQYGTIWLYGAKALGGPEITYSRVINGATNLPVDDLCEVSHQMFEYQFQLDAYRDNGTGDRGQETVSTTGPKLSAFDILMRLQTALTHRRNREALTEKCILLPTNAFGSIRNLAKPLIQNTFEGRASVDFFVRVRPLSSIRSPTYGDIDWGIVCPAEEVMFPDPPARAIC